MVEKKEKILELVRENSRLRKELDAMRSKDGVYLPSDQYTSLQQERNAQAERLNYLETVVTEKDKAYEVVVTEMEGAKEEHQAAVIAAKQAEVREG